MSPKNSSKSELSARTNDPSVLILIALSSGPKHGYALMQDIESFAGVRLGPGSLYGAISRLEERALIRAMDSQGRTKPYEITADGLASMQSTVAEMRVLVAEVKSRLTRNSRLALEGGMA